MNATRRLSIAALVVACTHLVFGAIVRISGSGMGCGDNWPKCYGYWIPPFSRPDLIVEVSHRYLASILTVTVLSLAAAAFRNRAETGGRGGPMRSAFGAVGAVFTAALLGGLTVKMGNAPWATVAHWLVAMTLLAMVAMTAIRSGALGGASALVQRGTRRAATSAFAAACLAIFAVALGGLTAKYPGAAVGCTTVPMCGPNPSVEAAGVHIQLTHRTIAVLLVLHLIGLVVVLRKRRETEAPVVVRAAHVALGMVLLQLVVASSMILFHLPPVLRSLHEATGVGIWLSCFTLAYLARRAAQVQAPEPARLPVPAPEQITQPAPVETRAPAPMPELAPEPVVAMADDTSNEASAEGSVSNDTVSVEDSGELDWQPRAAYVEEFDEFSRDALEAALEAEAAQVIAEVEAASAPERITRAVSESAPEAPVEAPQAVAVVEKVEPVEQLTGDSTAVAPVEAVKRAPVSPHTMAVLVARGADFL